MIREPIVHFDGNNKVLPGRIILVRHEYHHTGLRGSVLC